MQPPPGYGQQPPQGPPPGQFPPQGPPPGYGPRSAPEKRTGLIVGAAIGAVVLLAAISGALIWASSGGEYVAVVDDCGTVFEGNSLHDSPFGTLPSFNGGFSEEDPEANGSHGVLSCEGESGDLMVSFQVELFDMDHPETEEEMAKALDEEFDPSEEFGAEGIEQGVISDLDLGFGPGGEVLWDENSIGDRGVTIASTIDGGEFGGTGGFGAGAFLSGNAVGSVSVGVSGSDTGVEEMYATVEASLSDLESRIPRVAE